MFLEDCDDTPLSGRHYGKYHAVVTENVIDDDAHSGRIRVRITGLLEEDEGGHPRAVETVARPCLPPGFFFVPDRGSHVWVEFAAGDINLPLWVGVSYPEGERPQTGGGAEPGARQKVIRTAAGHVVTFDDEGESIEIRDKHGSRIVLDGDGVTIHTDHTIQLGSGARNPILKLDQADASASLLLQAILTHTHLGNLSAPTGPPQLAGGVPVSSMLQASQVTSAKVVAE